MCFHIDFGQEMCGKHPKRFASPDGGSDPIVSESTDGLIRTQFIHNPIWSGLTNGRGVAGRYDRLPNQYVPLHEECTELSDRRFYGTERDFKK